MNNLTCWIQDLLCFSKAVSRDYELNCFDESNLGPSLAPWNNLEELLSVQHDNFFISFVWKKHAYTRIFNTVLLNL